MVNKTIIKILTEHGLKITPQRIAILEVILGLGNHPTADDISDYLRLNYPHISVGTIYKTLVTFSEKGIIKKVHSDYEIIRYDGVKDKHHHLLCSDSEQIVDFYDKDLDSLLEEYFKKKNIQNFKIEDLKLQIIGKYTDTGKKIL